MHYLKKNEFASYATSPQICISNMQVLLLIKVCMASTEKLYLTLAETEDSDKSSAAYLRKIKSHPKIDRFTVIPKLQ